MSVERLPPSARDRIAAGEVVTRPAGVVAELLDNALDADADRIEISVEGDGTERIEVRDDGHGLGREDARLAVERHTTSKVGDEADLDAVGTLGFRGEALASIAAVSRLELVTSDGSGTATRVVVETGGDPTVEPTGRARGTTATVRDLFTNRPPRRESLGTTRTEFGRISRLVARYAVCRPGVAFTLVHDGRETLSTPGTGVTDAVLSVYDRSTASGGTTLTAERTVEDRALGIAGLVGSPATTRASPDHVHLAVNGRPLAEATDLRRAVRRGYGSLLPDGRHPVAALWITLPAEAVDPNVHPAKERVALRNAGAVADALETAVADALATSDRRRTAAVDTDLEAGLEPVDAAPDDPFDVDVIGQFRGTYLLCEADEDLLVVDQHAAHERVNYERFWAAIDDGVPSKSVDPPVPVDLDPAGAAVVAERPDELWALGFEAEPFGGSTVRVSAVPAPLGHAAAPEAIRDAVDALGAGSAAGERDDLLADLACHPSLKAGDEVDAETARRLLASLGGCEQPYACPHGRPTVLSVEEGTLARGFERGERRLE